MTTETLTSNVPCCTWIHGRTGQEVSDGHTIPAGTVVWDVTRETTGLGHTRTRFTADVDGTPYIYETYSDIAVETIERVPTVINVDRHGVATSAGRLSWSALDNAAEQEEPFARGAYQRLRAMAHSRVARVVARPDTLQVISDTGGATWRVTGSAWGRPVGRLAMLVDEGMEHGHRWKAAREAREIAERLGSSVRVIP